MADKKVINYKIVTAVVVNHVMDEVNDEIKKGWIIYGNPFLYAGCVSQAMVKYEEDVVAKRMDAAINNLMQSVDPLRQG